MASPLASVSGWARDSSAGVAFVWGGAEASNDQMNQTERTPMKSINECRLWLQSHEDLFKDLVRIYLGIGLFVKGLYFMSHHDEFNKLLETLDTTAFAQATVAHYVIPVHIIGGLLLAAGLLTRIAALAQIPILLGAVFYVYLPKMTMIEPRQNLEFSMLVLFLLALVFLYGAGRWSVDHWLTGRSREHLGTQPAS
jgi:uncharacterized membrane protein YphA (DoxX/SURF4 family)